jgi:hypothetical protein
MEGCDYCGSHRLCPRCQHAHMSGIRGEQQEHAHAQQIVIRKLLYINLMKNSDLSEIFYFCLAYYDMVFS